MCHCERKEAQGAGRRGLGERAGPPWAAAPCAPSRPSRAEVEAPASSQPGTGLGSHSPEAKCLSGGPAARRQLASNWPPHQVPLCSVGVWSQERLL